MDRVDILKLFDRRKPFFPFVLSYLFQVQGCLEVSLRYTLGKRPVDRRALAAKIGVSERTLVGSSESELGRNVDAVIRGLEQLSGPIRLASQRAKKELVADLDAEAGRWKDLVSVHSVASVSSLIVMTHAICQENRLPTKDATWEFFRHCRNAAAHGNRFGLSHGEPRHRAEWDGIVIDRAMHGKAMLGSPSDNALLFPGDALLMLHDVEVLIP